LRITRRLPGAVAPSIASRTRALVAASQPIDDPRKQFRKSIGGGKQSEWQAKAWAAYKEVGELRFYTGWRAASASRVRLIASEIDPDTGVPTGSIDPDNTEGQRVAEIVRSIAGGPLGHAKLIKRVVECLTIPGEVWIVILFVDQPDPANPQKQAPPTWLAVTPDEITAGGKDTTIELPNGEKYTYKDGKDGMFRVWNPAAWRAKEADSPVRATMDSLHEIVRTTKTISNASKSRLIGNGVVFVPQEMSLPTMNVPVASNKPGAPIPPVLQTAAVQQLQDLLFEVAKTAYDDEDSMAALIPMFAGVPGEMIAQVQHLKFDNTITDTAIKTRNDAIMRLAMGLDVSPERLLGMGSQSNHWSAWQIGDDDVRLHILPPVELLCDAITEQVLKKVLAKEGIDPNKYVVWHDASQLTVDPDKTDEARDAFDRGAITAEAMVKYLGLSDDSQYDFSTMDGWAQWARDRVGDDATLLPTLAQLIPELEGMEFQAPSQPELPPGDDTSADDGKSGAQRQQEPDTETDSEDNGDQAASLTERETTFAEAAIFRALELAGKRRRTRSLPYELRQVPDRELHRHLPAVSPSQVDELVRGWDAVLDDPVIRGLQMDAAKVRAVVRKYVTAELTKVVDA